MYTIYTSACMLIKLICMYDCVGMHLCMYGNVCMHIYIYMYMYMYMYI